MFDGYIRDHAIWSPRAAALILPGREIDYASLDGDVDRLAAALAAQGFGPDAGVVSVAVAQPDLQYALTAALARLHIASAPAADDRADWRITDAAADRPGPRTARITPEWVAGVLASERRRLPARLPDPLALGRVVLTPDGRRAPLTWRRLEQGNAALLRHYGHGRRGAWVATTGLDSLQGLAATMGAWSVGAAVVCGLSPETPPDWLERLDPGVLATTPRGLRDLLAALPEGAQPRPGWRIICSGGPLPRPLAETARLRITPDLRLLYSTPETDTIALGDAAGLADDPGQIGITPSGAIVQIHGDDGCPAADGQSGEVRVRGTRVIAGYLDDAEATEARFQDGWFLTGDLGRRLPDGRLVVEGRLGDDLILGGRRIRPWPLEAAALDVPGVVEAAAFTVPDPEGQDLAWLAVAAEPGFDREALARSLAAAEGLPPLKLAWIDAVPRDPADRPDRAALRAAVLAATGAG